MTSIIQQIFDLALLPAPDHKHEPIWEMDDYGYDGLDAGGEYINPWTTYVDMTFCLREQPIHDPY